MEDRETISDRLVHITLSGALPNTIVGAYMPPSVRHYEEKYVHMRPHTKLQSKRETKVQHSYQEIGMLD